MKSLCSGCKYFREHPKPSEIIGECGRKGWTKTEPVYANKLPLCVEGEGRNITWKFKARM